MRNSTRTKFGGDLGKSNKAQEEADNLEDEDNGGETNNEAKVM